MFDLEESEQVQFLLTSWLLNQCDDINANRARTHLKTREDGTHSLDPVYNPYKIWTFLNSHHALITESKLTHIDAALHTLRQNGSDDLHTHIDKFTALLNDYYEYEGIMATSQAARTLLRSLKPGYELTVKFIYRTIKPLTLEAVKKELLESEDEDKFETEAMAQVNYASHTNPASNSNTEANASRKFCTEDNCIGQTFKFPHEPKDCFKKPHNFNKRDKWIAEQEESRRKKKWGKGSAGAIRGIKKLTAPNASHGSLTFHASFEEMPDFENSQSSISVREDAEQSLEMYQFNLPHSTFNPASIQRQGRSTTEVELRLDRPEQVLEPISDTVLGHDNTGISVELTSDRILRFFYDNADINPYVSNNVFEEIDPTALSIQ